ncbi:MAG: DUF2182 domain-containing protein [Gemmatimonadaceae bacterium]
MAGTDLGPPVSAASDLVGRVARRPELVSLVALVFTVATAWVYLLVAPMPGMSGAAGSEGMAGMAGMAGMDAATALAAWSWREALLLFAMWAVMMVAMMLPSAAPMILLFSRVGASRAAHGRHGTSVLFFAAGYLTVWWVFSAVAAAVQWQLHSAAVLSPEMRAVSPLVGGAILIAAGVYQWLPIKESCLSHCRSPLGFLATSWREGKLGAVRMGLEHGMFCVGCCWLLMALLFVAGVMNLLWIAVLSVMVLLEKVVPRGALIARMAGVLLITAGVAIAI